MKPSTEVLAHNKIKKEIKIEDSKYDIKNEHCSPNFKDFHKKESESPNNILSAELADQMFLEAQDILLKSPWITNINISGEKEHLTEKEEKREGTNLNPITIPRFSKYNTNVDPFTSDDLERHIHIDQGVSHPKTSDYTYVIQNYGLNL